MATILWPSVAPITCCPRRVVGLGMRDQSTAGCERGIHGFGVLTMCFGWGRTGFGGGNGWGGSG